MLQWVPLNGITVNGINRSMESSITIFLNLVYVSSSFAYFYHLVNGISLGLGQSDPIKRRLVFQYNLPKQKNCNFRNLKFKSKIKFFDNVVCNFHQYLSILIKESFYSEVKLNNVFDKITILINCFGHREIFCYILLKFKCSTNSLPAVDFQLFLRKKLLNTF